MVRQQNNTKTAVAAAPTGATVKVTAHLCTNGVPAGPHAQACGQVAVRASKPAA